MRLSCKHCLLPGPGWNVRAGRVLAVVVLAWSLLSAVLRPAPTRPPTPPRPSQGQAAARFLRAVLRADYAGAYARLAPEVRRAVSLTAFAAAARPLWRSGQRPDADLRLYKLGLRLEARGAARLFYSFAFAADSGRKMPPMLLEVTFRDTAARAVLGFGLRPASGLHRLRVPPGQRPRASQGRARKQAF